MKSMRAKIAAVLIAVAAFASAPCFAMPDFTLAKASYRQRGVLVCDGGETPVDVTVFANANTIKAAVFSQTARLAALKIDGNGRPLLKCKSEKFGSFFLKATMLAMGFYDFFKPQIAHYSPTADGLPAVAVLLEDGCVAEFENYADFGGISLPKTLRVESPQYKLTLELVEILKKQ